MAYSTIRKEKCRKIFIRNELIIWFTYTSATSWVYPIQFKHRLSTYIQIRRPFINLNRFSNFWEAFTNKTSKFFKSNLDTWIHGTMDLKDSIISSQVNQGPLVKMGKVISSKKENIKNFQWLIRAAKVRYVTILNFWKLQITLTLNKLVSLRWGLRFKFANNEGSLKTKETEEI